MSNSFRYSTPLRPHRPTAAEVVVREGFICPICKEDLGSVDDLLIHFEHDHAEEDKTILQQLKGMLFKTVGRPDSIPPNQRIHHGSSDDEPENQPILRDPQDMGDFVNHTEYFRKIRDNRMERFLVETNKLVIRLDKLVHEAPSDPRQRAVFEKRLASWVQDGDVPICPGCGKTFKRFMRKHHCRLCGCIICSECSRFLDEDLIEALTNPVGAPLRRTSTDSGRGLTDLSGLAMKRSNSNESLMSIVASMGNKDNKQLVRVCEICKDHLDRRRKQMNEKHIKTELEDLNERIVFSISDAENIYPGYQEMAASLQAGETNFQLQQAAGTRNRLMQLFDTIDLYSKKIATLPESPSPLEQKLRNKIRLNATDFLKSHVLTMSVLPSPEQCLELQRTRREEMKVRLAAKRAADEERKRALQQARNNQSSSVAAHKKTEKPPKNPFEDGLTKGSSLNPFEDSDTESDHLNPFNEGNESALLRKRSSIGQQHQNGGWVPEPLAPEDLDQDDDPVLQQIAIVKKTLEQAKKAGRMDEILSLSQNLSDLTLFYKQQVLQQL